MKFRCNIVALLCLLSSVGAADCCRTESERHFVDIHGSTLEQLEPARAPLYAFFREATPETIVVEYRSEGASLFSPERDAVGIALDAWRMAPLATVAHESSHLALHHLTEGASNTEPLRFLDEGLAEFFEHRVADDLQAYRSEALGIAADDHAGGHVSFAAMQTWDTFFGRPPNQNRRAYSAGASVVFFLVERFGEEKLRSLLSDLGRTRDLDASCRAQLGRPVAEVEADWSAWLKLHRPEADAKIEIPQVVRRSPANDCEDVSTDLREVEVEFSADMVIHAPLCVITPCQEDICYTEARWKSPRILAIRTPKGLRAQTDYRLTLGREGCQLKSRAGGQLPITEWHFKTSDE